MTASMLRIQLLGKGLTEEMAASIVASRFPKSVELPELTVVKAETKH